MFVWITSMFFFFFFNDTATTEIYTLSLHHALPISIKVLHSELAAALGSDRFLREIAIAARLQHPHILPLYDSGTDRKSTRLNSSHGYISYAVFCLKKKKQIQALYLHSQYTTPLTCS